MIAQSVPGAVARLAAVVGAACALLAPALAAPLAVIDDTGRSVEIADASRIVSLGGSVTEILYALGLEDRIVAVDSTSIHPPSALADHPDVGYLRALSPEGVLSAGGTLIIAESDAGPEEAVTLLESASIPFVRVPGETTPEGIVAKIRLVAEAAGVPEEGARLARNVERDIERARAGLSGIAEPARVLFVLSLRDGRVMAAGAGTSAEAMIALAGAENAMTGFSGYKQVNDESIIEAAPDVIVTMSRGDHAAGEDAYFSHPAIARTPAGRDRRLVAMDGLYLLGFGPRTAQAIGELAAGIYPDLDAAASGQ